MVNPQQTGNELDVGPLISAGYASTDFLDELADAIDLASYQGGITWLTERGKCIAAVVPVDMAEYVERQVDAIP